MKKNSVKNCVLFTIIFLLFSFPFIVMGQGKFATIKKGQKAQFSGYLLNEFGLATLTAKTEMAEKVCKVKIVNQEKISKLNLDKQKLLFLNEIKNLKKSHEAILKIKNEQLIKIENVSRTSKKTLFERFKETSFWTGLAIGVGVGMVVSASLVMATRK